MTIERDKDGEGMFEPKQLGTSAFDDFVAESDNNFGWLLEANPCILAERTKLRLTRKRPYKIKFSVLPNYMHDVASAVGIALHSLYQKSEMSRKYVGVVSENVKAKLVVSIHGQNNKPYDFRRVVVQSGEIIYLHHFSSLREISERNDENPIALFQVHEVSLRYGTVTIGPLLPEESE